MEARETNLFVPSGSRHDAVVHEDADLPGNLKRNLTQLRELDAQSQELFERMSKLSKNHILRAKKAVQEGREPDEEYLVKARRAYKELVELDEEKLGLAEQMHAEVARHFDFCSSELRKFEEELKEKGQLKTPQMKTQQLARQDSAGSLAEAGGAEASAALTGAGAGGSGSANLPPLPSGDSRGRGRANLGASGAADAASGQPSSANSHKRGRGRKVSFKEAERQRQQAEAMEQRQQAAAERAGTLQGPAPVSDGAAAASAPGYNYANATLPLAPREESNLPLCGAVAAAVDYIIPERSMVCAKPPSVKMQPQDWILGTVLKYVAASNKYIIVDEDDSDADPWAQASGRTQHQVPGRMVLPLPLTEPSMYTQYNEFARGVWVLALYPDTTCFYKALVHTPPSMMAGGPPKDYLVEFEDDSEASGKGEPMRVPTKYVLRLSQ